MNKATNPIRGWSWDEIRERSQMSYPCQLPHPDITFAMVVWNDEERAGALLSHVRPYFNTVAVAVQESSDLTLEVAKSLADIVVTDRHWGFGDASFGPKLLPRVPTRWTFKCDADEWPDEELLWSLCQATWWADQIGTAGLWIPFRSFTDGLEWNQDHAHLRLFQTRYGWPGKLHSRPPIENGETFPHGSITHTRSLDEMMQDYLRYWHAGRGDAGWEEHNRLMMYEATRGTAAVKGWDYVRSFPWWPEVEAIAYKGKEKPWQQL